MEDIVWPRWNVKVNSMPLILRIGYVNCDIMNKKKVEFTFATDFLK